MRKPDFCIGTTQLISVFVFATWIAQSLYFLNPKFQSVVVQPGLCRTWSETPKTCFCHDAANIEPRPVKTCIWDFRTGCLATEDVWRFEISSDVESVDVLLSLKR